MAGLMGSAVFWVFTIIYMAGVFFLGYLGYKRTKASEDFMLAGRKIHP